MKRVVAHQFAKVGNQKANQVATGYGDAQAFGDNQPALEGWAREQGFSTYSGLGWTVLAVQGRDEALLPATLALMMTTAVVVVWRTGGFQ